MIKEINKPNNSKKRELHFVTGNFFERNALTPEDASKKNIETVLHSFRDSDKLPLREVYDEHIKWRARREKIKSLNGNGRK